MVKFLIDLFKSQFNNFPITFFRSGAGEIIKEINNNPIIGKSLANTKLQVVFPEQLIEYPMKCANA